MLKLAALIPLVIFAVIQALVGVRLLMLARRNRGLPELMLGSGLVMIGFVGTPLTVAGRTPATVGTPLGYTCFAVGILVVLWGIGHLFAFTWLVFRARDRWAKAMMIAVAASLAWIGFGMVYASVQEHELAKIIARTRPWSFATMILLTFQFVWSGFESTRYYLALRRRLALGIADPVVVNRFLLWGVSGAVAALLTSGLVFCLHSGMLILRDATPLILMAVAGLLTSAGWTLTFFPPKAYREYLRRRA